MARIPSQQGLRKAAVAILSILFFGSTNATADPPVVSGNGSTSATDTSLAVDDASRLKAPPTDAAKAETPDENEPEETSTASADLESYPCAQFFRLLSELAIPHDPRNLEAAALRAMLFAIDRHAALLSADEADRQRRLDQGWSRNEAVRSRSTDGIADSDSESPDGLRAAWTIETWPQNIVYVNVPGFYPDSHEDIATALDLAATGSVNGLILDVRHAGGRNVDTVDRGAGYFFDAESPLYTLQTHDGQILRSGKAHPVERPMEAPTLLITGGQTTEAAELLAAVLRNARGVMLLGDRTRGDPLLRELHRWSDDQYLYLPVARMVPDQHPDYEMVGVVPHITIRPPRSPSAAPADAKPKRNGESEFPERVDRDPVLSRAVDILVGLHAVSMPD